MLPGAGRPVPCAALVPPPWLYGENAASVVGMDWLVNAGTAQTVPVPPQRNPASTSQQRMKLPWNSYNV